ncbi:hypothetical protein BP6252_12497 [Coleophoma cylindrospora]|uniref:Peptidase S33 tripeptidyl aminopeptidase-like C-terminal domain-containing protein n=1 Tax=Coleophoma cylindrospora TaxID=1849047 RepID=A0A3D8QCN6_9HELO|nr:hypothetical protein BP6252_12497 [Coleophoma cylindrospora]
MVMDMGKIGTISSTVSASDKVEVSWSIWLRSLAISAAALFLIFKSTSITPISPPSTEGGTRSKKTHIVTASKEFKWENITPSKELLYHDCFGKLQCARLEVPLDYKRTDGRGLKVAVALIRQPAKVPITDPRYGGAVIIEPGGPGGSGVDQLLRAGSEIQDIVSSHIEPELASVNPANKYYDVIGFDPRGVNNTTPSVRCFPDALVAQNWKLQSETIGIFGSAPGTLTRLWERSQALSRGCSEALMEEIDGERVAEHLNTIPVVEDMVHMIERHGQWRQKQALAMQDAYAQAYGTEMTKAMLDRTKWSKGKEMLYYWGFSYGTVIGTTFAAMHPERVARVVVDGVVDADDHYHGTKANNLWDADSILSQFFIYCSEAGPAKCSFYTPGGPKAIQAIYNELISNIYEHPIVVPGSATHGPEIITWSDIKSMQSPSLYQPLHRFPVFSMLLRDLVTGNGSKFAEYKQHKYGSICPVLDCGSDDNTCSPGRLPLATPEAYSAILCTDSSRLGDVSKGGFEACVQRMTNQSASFGAVWAHNRLGCVGWNATAKWSFNHPIAAVKTAHPLIFIGNTFDPVTPIRNARKMSSQFPGSIVIEQRAEGHCSLAAPSLCTMRHIRNYFQTGAMPIPDKASSGVSCETDLKPLVDAVSNEWSPPESIDIPAFGRPPTELQDIRDLKILLRASKKFTEGSVAI